MCVDAGSYGAGLANDSLPVRKSDQRHDLQRHDDRPRVRDPCFRLLPTSKPRVQLEITFIIARSRQLPTGLHLKRSSNRPPSSFRRYEDGTPGEADTRFGIVEYDAELQGMLSLAQLLASAGTRLRLGSSQRSEHPG